MRLNGRGRESNKEVSAGGGALLGRPHVIRGQRFPEPHASVSQPHGAERSWPWPWPEPMEPAQHTVQTCPLSAFPSGPWNQHSSPSAGRLPSRTRTRTPDTSSLLSRPQGTASLQPKWGALPKGHLTHSRTSLESASSHCSEKTTDTHPQWVLGGTPPSLTLTCLGLTWWRSHAHLTWRRALSPSLCSVFGVF